MSHHAEIINEATSEANAIAHNALIVKPRIVLEQLPDGTLVIESYTNGQRHRETLSRGFEMIAIRDELARQTRAIANAAEEKALREEREIAARHRRVYAGIAYGAYGSRGHGKAFADRVMGGNANPAPGRATPPAEVKEIANSVEDLL